MTTLIRLLQDKLVWGKMCSLFCANPHVDFCDAHDLPTVGNLNKNFPIGRFWRFQVMYIFASNKYPFFGTLSKQTQTKEGGKKKIVLILLFNWQALGDPTVEMFGSRDVDSYLMPREKAAVDEWMKKQRQFHIMRDGPFHITTILAGLWGANNYQNLKKVMNIRKRLLDVPVRHWKFYDQAVLHRRVWPAVR